MSVTVPTLSVRIGNPGAPSVVFVSAAYADNRLSLELSSNAPLELQPGPAAWLPTEQLPGAAGSAICVDLGAIASLHIFQALHFLPRPDGWAVLRPPPENPSTSIILTPLSPTVLQPGQPLEFGIGQFAITSPPGEAKAQVRVDAYRIGGLAELVSPGATVWFQDASQHKDLRAVLAVSAPQPFVVLNSPDYPPVRNRLSVLLGPGSAPFPVIPGPQTAFTLAFTYAAAAPGAGALCTPADAAAIRVLPSVGAAGWTVSRNEGAAALSWLVTPPAGTPVLGPDGLGTVQFQIEGVSSTLVEGPTELRLLTSAVPGYADATYAVPLEKVAHVDVGRFTATVLPGGGAQNVQLSWTPVKGTAILVPPGRDVTGLSSLRVGIDKTTTFTLVAQGLEQADSGNVAVKTATASMAALLTASATATSKTTYMLSWSAPSASFVQVEGRPGLLPPIGSLSGTATLPVTLTLQALDAARTVIGMQPCPVPPYTPPQLGVSATPQGLDGIALSWGSLAAASLRLGDDAALFAAAGGSTTRRFHAGAPMPQSIEVAALDSLGGMVGQVTLAASWVLAGTSFGVGGPVAGLAVSDDGRHLFAAAASVGGIAVIDTLSAGSVATIPVPQGVTCVAVATPFPLLVAGCADGSVLMIDTGTLAMVRTLNAPPPPAPPQAATAPPTPPPAPPSPASAAAAAGDGRVFLGWSMAGGAVANCQVLSPAGRLTPILAGGADVTSLAVSGGQVMLADANGAVFGTHPPTGLDTSRKVLAARADGAFLFVAGKSGIGVYNAAGSAAGPGIPVPGAAALALSACETRLFIASAAGVQVADVHDPTTPALLAGPIDIRNVAILVPSRAGTVVYAGCTDGSIAVLQPSFSVAAA